MKKYLFILTFLFCAVICFAQYPLNQSIGADSTLVTSKGGLKGRIINFQFDDTTQANTQRISQYPSAQIVTKAGLFYIRDSSATRWILLGSGFSPNPTCGLSVGTGIVSYDDSTLNFDVTAAIYALCCDNVPRNSPFTHVTLDSNDASDPRIDAIVLDSTGVVVLKGTPNPNPAAPEISSCQILLTTVLINAGENIPANISVNFIPYDEGLGISGGEWDTASHGLTVNFRDTQHPIHLTHDIHVSPFTTATSNSITLTSDSTIQITNYSVLKIYVLLTSFVAPSPTAFMNVRWGLNGFWQSNSLSVLDGQYGFSRSSLVYQVITIPISSFGLYANSVNQLQLTFLGNNTTGFYIDWIQLQSGLVPPTPTVQSIQQITVTGNNLITPNVINPNGQLTTIQLPIASTTSAYTVWGNHSAITGQASFGKLDLANEVTGLLALTNIAPGNENDIMQVVGGVWTAQPAALPAADTISVTNPLGVILSGNPSIPDTLFLKYTNFLTLKGDSLSLGGNGTQNTILNAGLYRIALIGTTDASGNNGLFSSYLTGNHTGSSGISYAGLFTNRQGEDGFFNTSVGIRGQADSVTQFSVGVQGFASASDGYGGTFSIDQISSGAGVVGVTGGEISMLNLTTAQIGLPSVGGWMIKNNVGSDTVSTSLLVTSLPASGSAAIGFGTSIDFGTINTVSNRVISKWTSLSGSNNLTSQFIVTGINKSTTNNLLEMGDRVTLTESSATTFATTTIASGKIAGGEIIVTIEANDGTDYQSRTQRFIWTAENKAGTTTITISTPEEVVAVSTGTLTSTITAVDAGSGVINFKSNAVSSLTQTTLRATYYFQQNF